MLKNEIKILDWGVREGKEDGFGIGMEKRVMGEEGTIDDRLI